MDDKGTICAVWGSITFNMTNAPNGRIDVVWWDTRNETGVRSNDVYYTSSTDDGLQWSKNIRVTDRSVDRPLGVWGFNFDMSTPPGLASTNAFAITAWDDTRNSEPGASASEFSDGYGGGLQDIYAAVVQYRAVGGGTSKVAKAALAGAGGLLAVGIVLSVLAFATRRSSPPAKSVDAGRARAGVR